MSPRSDKVGVAPEVALAMIESDVHHLREQSDIDRRGFVRRLHEDRERLDRIDKAQGVTALEMARASDGVRRLERIAEAQEGTLKHLLETVYGFRGGLRLVKWVIGGGFFVEAIRLYMEHMR
jgi:hypothetical protein